MHVAWFFSDLPAFWLLLDIPPGFFWSTAWFLLVRELYVYWVSHLTFSGPRLSCFRQIWFLSGNLLPPWCLWDILSNLFHSFFFRPIIYCPIPCRMAIRLLPGLLPSFYYFCCVSSIGPTVHSLISFGVTTTLLSDPPLNHCQSLHLISNSHLFDLYKNNCSISAFHWTCIPISFSSAACVLVGPQLHLHLIHLPAPVKPTAWFLLALLPFPFNPPPFNFFKENHIISIRDLMPNFYLPTATFLLTLSQFPLDCPSEFG